jgi:hypothetical protein
MGLRIAAAVTVAVIAIALVAAFLATHHGAVGSVPAGQDQNVHAYQTMIGGDYTTMSNSTSANCDTIQDNGCATAVNRVVPTLQRWVSDLDEFPTPPRYALLDGQLRHHLNEVIAELNAAVAFQKKNDAKGFDLAMNAAVYERGWIDPITFTIEGTYARMAPTYLDAVRVAKQALQACMDGSPGPGELGCAHLTAMESCAGALAERCESDVQSAATELQTFLIALAQNPAPSALSAKDAQLTADLARADTALLGITDALLGGDSAKVAASESAYMTAINDADRDAQAIPTG